MRLSRGQLSFNGNPVFVNLSVEFDPGSFTCILGASGVGKTSLLRMLAGLIPKSEGVTLGSDGESLDGRIAYMDQRDLLLPWLDVLNNVLLGARLRGQPQDTNRAFELLAQIGLENQHHMLSGQLSGGMRQRVALARTLMEDRPVVLMDEPFAAVDALTRLKLQELSARLLLDRTVIMVTHDPMEAVRIGQCIYVLSGSPATLDDGLYPTSPGPRDLTSPETMDLHRRLLKKLGVAVE